MDQFKFVKTDQRNKYTTKLRPKRLNQQSKPDLIKYIDTVDNSTKVYMLDSLVKLTEFTDEYINNLNDGHLCFIYDQPNGPISLYFWSEKQVKWILYKGIGEEGTPIDLGNIGTQPVNESGIANNVIPVYDAVNNEYQLKSIEKLLKTCSCIKGVNTKAELNLLLDNKAGDIGIVLRDETRDNISVLYRHDGTSFVFVNEFKCRDRDFINDPLDLTTEVKGTLPPINMDSSVITDKDIDKTAVGKITEDANGNINYAGKDIAYDDTTIKDSIGKISDNLVIASEKIDGAIVDIANNKTSIDNVVIEINTNKTHIDQAIIDITTGIESNKALIDQIELELADKRGKNDKIDIVDLSPDFTDKINKIEKDIEDSGFKYDDTDADF